MDTFSSLLRDRAHWEFELLVGFLEMLVFDGVVLGLCWPFIRKHWQHHVDRDQLDANPMLWTNQYLHPFDIPAGAIITNAKVEPVVHDWSLSCPDHVKHNPASEEWPELVFCNCRFCSRRRELEKS